MLRFKDEASKKLYNKGWNHGDFLSNPFTKKLAQLMVEDFLNLVISPKFEEIKNDPYEEEIEIQLKTELARRGLSPKSNLDPSTMRVSSPPQQPNQKKNKVDLYRKDTGRRHGFNSKQKSRLNSPENRFGVGQGNSKNKVSLYPRDSNKFNQKDNLTGSGYQPIDSGAVTELNSPPAIIGTKKVNHWDSVSNMSLCEDARFNPKNVENWHDVKSPERKHISPKNSMRFNSPPHNLNKKRKNKFISAKRDRAFYSPNQFKKKKNSLPNVEGVDQDFKSKEATPGIPEDTERRNLYKGFYQKTEEIGGTTKNITIHSPAREDQTAQILKTKKKAQKPFFAYSQRSQLNSSNRFRSLDMKRKGREHGSKHTSPLARLGQDGLKKSNKKEKRFLEPNPLKRRLKKTRTTKNNSRRLEFPSPMPGNDEDQFKAPKKTEFYSQKRSKLTSNILNRKWLGSIDKKTRTKKKRKRVKKANLKFSDSESQFNTIKKKSEIRQILTERKIIGRTATATAAREKAGTSTTIREKTGAAFAKSLLKVGPKMTQSYIQKLYNSKDKQNNLSSGAIHQHQKTVENTAAKIIRTKSQEHNLHRMPGFSSHRESGDKIIESDGEMETLIYPAGFSQRYKTPPVTKVKETGEVFESAQLRYQNPQQPQKLAQSPKGEEIVVQTIRQQQPAPVLIPQAVTKVKEAPLVTMVPDQKIQVIETIVEEAVPEQPITGFVTKIGQEKEVTTQLTAINPNPDTINSGRSLLVVTKYMLRATNAILAKQEHLKKQGQQHQPPLVQKEDPIHKETTILKTSYLSTHSVSLTQPGQLTSIEQSIRGVNEAALGVSGVSGLIPEVNEENESKDDIVGDLLESEDADNPGLDTTVVVERFVKNSELATNRDSRSSQFINLRGVKEGVVPFLSNKHILGTAGKLQDPNSKQ